MWVTVTLGVGFERGKLATILKGDDMLESVLTADDDTFDKATTRLRVSRILRGEGTYGIAFNGDEGQVIKLHKADDKAYLKFITWVQTLTTEPYKKHFPKILYCEYRGDYVTLVMERLWHPRDMPDVEVNLIPPSITYNQNSVHSAMAAASGRLVYAVNESRNQQYMFKNFRCLRVIDSLECAFQALIREVYVNGEFAVDLHSDNIMFRRDLSGSLDAVLLDPFTY